MHETPARLPCGSISSGPSQPVPSDMTATLLSTATQNVAEAQATASTLLPGSTGITPL